MTRRLVIPSGQGLPAGKYPVKSASTPRTSPDSSTNSGNKLPAYRPVNSPAHTSTNYEASEINYTNDTAELEAEESPEVNDETNITLGTNREGGICCNCNVSQSLQSTSKSCTLYMLVQCAHSIKCSI